MKFALLCDDPSATPIIDALCRCINGHQLTYAVQVTRRADELLHNRAGVRLVPRWEDLPLEIEINAALVGGSDQEIQDGAKQLATAGIPILFLPHAGQGSTFAYEIGLIRDDNQVVIFPLFWHRYDTAVIALKHALNEGRLGRIQFLQLSRVLSRESTNTPLSQFDVDAELLHDVDLMRWLIGDYDQVTALRAAASSEGLLMQNVVLAGRTLPEANWSIRPSDGAELWQLTVRGESGAAELQRDPASRRWTCQFNDQHQEGDEPSTVRSALNAFVTAADRSKKDTSHSHESDSNEWADAVKCFETVDATHRSVKRRRTIELHFEPMSERAIFKSQMTAMGCGVLVATFFLSLLYLAVASFVPPLQRDNAPSVTKFHSGDAENETAQKAVVNPGMPIAHRILIGLRILVFAPLAIFLIAQILLPLTRPSSNEQQAAGDKYK